VKNKNIPNRLAVWIFISIFAGVFCRKTGHKDILDAQFPTELRNRTEKRAPHTALEHCAFVRRL